MRECPICLKDDMVIIIKTWVDYRKYKCLRCDKEWEGKPTHKEIKDFNE